MASPFPTEQGWLGRCFSKTTAQFHTTGLTAGNFYSLGLPYSSAPCAQTGYNGNRCVGLERVEEKNWESNTSAQKCHQSLIMRSTGLDSVPYQQRIAFRLN